MTDLNEYLTPFQKQMITELNNHDVRYLVVGALAVAYHGYPRASEDLDIFFEQSRPNIDRLIRALDAFTDGEFSTVRTRDDLMEIEAFFVGEGTNVIDFLSIIDGVTFNQCWEHRVSFETIEETIPVIAREQLIKNKKNTGRTRDKADVEALENDITENDS
ncbi:MAG: hypothetical protein ABEJ65_07960 [bacterium]